MRVSSSIGKIPFLAPASIAILAIVKRSVMLSSLTPSPANSNALYKAPSTPIMPIKVSITSLPQIYLGFLPVILTLIVSGTLNHASPVARATPKSVEPTPVENPPKAPYVQV